MEYQVNLGEKHKIFLSAKDSPDESFKVRDLQVDLSHANLFMDQNREPDKTGAQHALIPLAEQARIAFADIDNASTGSPLVSSLKTYRDTRLPALLVELEQSRPLTQIDLSPYNRPEHQKKFEVMLKEMIREIERELPHYFRTEKEIGTFDWLKIGALEHKIPVPLAGQRPLEKDQINKGDQLLADLSGRFIEFDATKNTAHVLTGEKPSAQCIVEALCNSGTLGREFSELNRGVALKLVATPAISIAELFSEVDSIKKSALDYKPDSKVWTVAKAITPGILAASLISLPVVSHVISNTITPFDLVRTVLACGVSSLALFTARLALRNREAQTRMGNEIRQSIESGTEAPNPTGVGALNIFSTALIDQTVHASSGSPQFRLAPKTLESWMGDIPQLRFPDRSSIPSKIGHLMGMKLSIPVDNPIKEPISVECQDDFSGQELELEQIQDLTMEPIVRIVHIERAFETWNILQANSLLREYAERQSLPSAGAPWLDRKQALINGLASQTDESITYPEASKTFSGLTEFFKLSMTSWGHISRALASAAALERMHETNQAQAIAQRVFKRHFS